MQDFEGRGPFRPGFSHRWIDESKPFVNLPTCFSEFGLHNVLRKARGRSIGCGCDSLDQIQLWFNANEMATLHGLGFSLVRMEVDEILGTSQYQTVFARKKPLNQDFEVVV